MADSQRSLWGVEVGCRERVTIHLCTDCPNERHPHSREVGAHFQLGNLAVRCGDQWHHNLESEAVEFASATASFAPHYYAATGPTIGWSGCSPCCGPLCRWHSSRVRRPTVRHATDL